MIIKTITVLLLAQNSSLAKRIRTSLYYSQLRVFKVVYAKEQTKALELINSSSIDIVLLDLSVANAKSAEFVNRLRHNSPKTIIMLLCNANDNAIVSQAMAQGAHGFIDKHSLGQHWLMRLLGFSLLQTLPLKLQKRSIKTLHAICDSSQLGIMAADWFGNIIYTNQAFNTITAYSAATPQGCHWMAQIYDDDKNRLLTDLQAAQKNNTIVCSDVCIIHQSKQLCQVRVTATPIAKNKKSYGYIITLEKLSKRDGKAKLTAAVTKTRRDLLPATTAQLTLDAMSDAILSTDINDKVLYLNQAASILTGWDCSEAVGLLLCDIFKIKESASAVIAKSTLAQSQREQRPFDCILVRKDGVEIQIEESARTIFNELGETIGVVFIFRDVTQSQLKAIKMKYLAQHDPLTGLPNRLLFQERLNQALVLAKRHNKRLAVLYLDIDLFKKVNDLHGHELGDKLLCSIANRMTDAVRQSDTVCRQGGDEFLILLSEIEHPDDAAIFTSKLLHTLINPHQLNGKKISVHMSIGIRIFHHDIEAPQQASEGKLSDVLIDNADKAMYQAKSRGHDGYQIFKQA